MNPLILAPTSLLDVPPVPFVRLAGEVGYDGVGIRLHPSPGLPFHPVVGDREPIREMKRLIGVHGLRVVDIFTFYLQPDTDVGAFRPALELGAELGAGYAVVQGDDPEPARLRDRFDALCAIAGELHLTAIVEFVPARAVATLDLALQLLSAVARENTAILIDPLHLARSGGSPADVERMNPRLLPFAQFCDGVLAPGELDLASLGKPMSPGARLPPGQGRLPLRELLKVLPAELPLSIEVLPRRGIGLDEARAWVAMLLRTTRQFLSPAGRHSRESEDSASKAHSGR